MAAEPPSHRARLAPRRVVIATGIATGVCTIAFGVLGGDGPAATAAWSSGTASGTASGTEAAVTPSPELASFLDRWCLGCHAGADAEAGFDLMKVDGIVDGIAELSGGKGTARPVGELFFFGQLHIANGLDKGAEAEAIIAKKLSREHRIKDGQVRDADLAAQMCKGVV